MNTMKEWFSEHKVSFLRYGLLLVVFLAGLALPSPFFENIGKITTDIESVKKEFVDVTNMEIKNGRYSGTIIKNTQRRHGSGRFEINGSIYEGEWKNDQLQYGKRTTSSSVYTGRFDKELNNDGFGIIEYNERYIKKKAEQGVPDSKIIVKYIGNWKKNHKQGLGRAIKKDGSMDFGRYSAGVLQKKNRCELQGRQTGVRHRCLSPSDEH